MSIIRDGDKVDDKRMKVRTKKAEPFLTLPQIVIYTPEAYFLIFFLNRLNPNAAPPTIKRVELTGSGTTVV